MPEGWLLSQRRCGFPFKIRKDIICPDCSVVRTPQNTSPHVDKKSHAIILQNVCTQCIRKRRQRKRILEPEWHERVKERSRKRRKSTKNGAIRHIARNAVTGDRKMIAKRGLEFSSQRTVYERLDMLVNRMDELLQEQKGLCASCYNPMIVGGDRGPLKASLDRLDNDSLHEPDNLRMTCQLCNYRRNDLTLEQWNEKINGTVNPPLPEHCTKAPQHCMRLIATAKVHCKKQGMPYEGPKSYELLDMIDKQDRTCPECKNPYHFMWRYVSRNCRLKSDPEVAHNYPSMDQRVPGQGYGLDNLQIMCKSCNKGKNNF